MTLQMFRMRASASQGSEVNTPVFFYSPTTSVRIPGAPGHSERSQNPKAPKEAPPPSTSWPHLLLTLRPQSIVFTEVLIFHQGGEVCVYLCVSVAGRWRQDRCIWLSPQFSTLCLCVCVCVCVCYEPVIRVVTHLSNAPIPLGCHTL